MGVFARREDGNEERPGDGGGLEVDLDLRACPQCRRSLHPWERTCPDDGSAAVAAADLPPAGLPPLPDHLRED